MKVGVAVLAALVLAGTAAASTTPTPWTRANMTAAVKVIGYPAPHAKKVTCRGLGAPDGLGRYNQFRCLAIYKRRPTRRAFFIEGQNEGGWLCAGMTATSCKTLRHGFVTRGQVSTDGSLAAAADLAARGYMTNRYGTYQATGFCKGGPPTWTCPFANATVTITTKVAKGGYVIAGSG